MIPLFVVRFKKKEKFIIFCIENRKRKLYNENNTKDRKMRCGKSNDYI